MGGGGSGRVGREGGVQVGQIGVVGGDLGGGDLGCWEGGGGDPSVLDANYPPN